MEVGLFLLLVAYVKLHFQAHLVLIHGSIPSAWQPACVL